MNDDDHDDDDEDDDDDDDDDAHWLWRLTHVRSWLVVVLMVAISSPTCHDDIVMHLI